MTTTAQWLEHFTANLQKKRIHWEQTATTNNYELKNIIPSLQAWQLGETSDGSNLIKAATNYATKNKDSNYVEVIKLFIKEEQKHGYHLGKYLQAIDIPLLKKNWGDTLFRKIRHLNNSMEMWTLAVLTTESAAQIFYQSIKEATQCELLQNICTDILIDESYHIDFQKQRFKDIVLHSPSHTHWFRYIFYKVFYFTTAQVIWYAHKKAFMAGNNSHELYNIKMKLKFTKTIERIFMQQPSSWLLKHVIPAKSV